MTRRERRKDNDRRRRREEEVVSTAESDLASSLAFDRVGERYCPPDLTQRDMIDQLVEKVDREGTDKYRSMLSEQQRDVLSLGSSPRESEERPASPQSIDAATSSMLSIEYELQQKKQQEKMEADIYKMLEDTNEYYPTQQKFAYISVFVSSLQLLVLTVQVTLCGVAPLDVNPLVGPYPDAISEWGGKNTYLLLVRNQWFRLITPTFLHVGILQLLVNVAIQLETGSLLEREWGSIKFAWYYLLSAVGCNLISSVTNPETIAVGSSGTLMGLFGAKLAQVLIQVFWWEQHGASQTSTTGSSLSDMGTVDPLSFDSQNQFSESENEFGHRRGRGRNRQPPKRSRKQQIRQQAAAMVGQDDAIRLEQVSFLLCTLSVLMALSFFTYIDWSGHMAGLWIGFCTGLVAFSRPLKSIVLRFSLQLMGLVLLLSSFGATIYILLGGVLQPNAELGDPCEYFANLFAEGYDCNCVLLG